MKKFFLILFLVFSVPAFAANYTFILEDGTTIECDSYREESGRYYYEGMYGFEAFVSTDYVIEIVDNLKEASIDNFVEKLREGDEDAIKELFEYVAMEFLNYLGNDERKFETERPRGPTIDKVTIDTETVKYSVDRSDSLLYPYVAEMQIGISAEWGYGGDEIWHPYSRIVTLKFRYNEDIPGWQFYEAFDENGYSDSTVVVILKDLIGQFEVIQDELITRGSQ